MRKGCAVDSKDTIREQKLQVILCGPLPKTERALLRRGDVEIIREKKNLNLLIGLNNGAIDCDMMIVEAPNGHGLYGLTYPMGKRKTCPVWMVADPPHEAIWNEINRQLGEAPAKRQAERDAAITVGPPKHEILILADTPQQRDRLTGWAREIYASWKMTLPPLTVPEDVKAYLRELPRPSAPPAAVVIEMAGVDSLNAAEQIRRLYPKVGLVWCCDLNFSAQAYHLDVDYFYLFSEADIGKFGIGLNRAQLLYNKRGNTL